MNSNGIISFMDFLDLDEELIDERVRNLMKKKRLTNEHLANLLNLLLYKQLINTREESECCNKKEFNFACKLIVKINEENISIICKVIKAILMLQPSAILDKAEHLIQQILYEIELPEPIVKANADIDCDEFTLTLLLLKICDSILDAVLQCGCKLMLPFIVTPLEHIICTQNDALKAYFLTNTVSRFHRCIVGYNLLDRLWKFLFQIKNGNIELKVLSCLSNFYLPIQDSSKNLMLKSYIIYEIEFWSIVLFGLSNEDVSTRKHAVYLAKRAVDCAFNNNKCINIVSHNTYIFRWNYKSKTYLRKIWDNYFTLIDALDEKQSNIVIPSLKLFYAVKDLGLCWLNCAFNIGLCHDNAQVRYKCLQYRLKFLIKDDNDALHLLQAINDISLYEHRDEYKPLKIRLKENFLNNDTLFHVLKVMPVVKWSPVPLYHLTTILADITNEDLGNKIFPRVIDLIGNILKIPCNNIEIRTAVYINISYFIGKCCKGLDWEKYINLYFSLQLHVLSLESKNPFIDYIRTEVVVDDCTNLLRYIKFSPEVMDFGITYCKSNNTLAIVDYVNESISKIEDLNNQPHYNKSRYLNEAIFLVQLYKRIIQQKGPFFDVLNERLQMVLQVLLDYVISLLINTICMSIEDMYLFFEGFDALNKEIRNETVLLLFKSGLLVLKDDKIDVHKKTIVIFILNSCLKSPIMVELKQDEQDLKTFIDIIEHVKFNHPNKENSGRIKNAFFEKACEITYFYIMKNLSHEQEVVNFAEFMLESGGYGCLKWIIRIMNKIIPDILDDSNVEFNLAQFLMHIWREIGAVKSNSQYSICIEEFIYLIMQDTLLERPECNGIIILYCYKILDYAAMKNVPLYYLVRRMCEMNISNHTISVLSGILLYASIPRKAHRITEKIIADIILEPALNFETEEPDYEINKSSVILDSDIIIYRICALSKITDTDILSTSMTCMIQKVEETFRNKQRYHANSHHERVLQSCIQNFIFIFLKSRNVNLHDTTLEWVIEFLGRIPHQPFVKICFEWYIALYFYNKETILNANMLNKLKEKNVPLQSQFMILYWLVMHRIKRKTCVQDEFDFFMETILSHIMGPIYSTRLYSQYLSIKVFDANDYLNSDKYAYTVNVIKKTIAQNAEANDKNFIKLSNDYFVHKFDIVEDLTPSEIYWYLPRCVCESVWDNEGIKKDVVESAMREINDNIRSGSCDTFLSEWKETHNNHEIFAVSQKSNSTVNQESDFDTDSESDSGIIQKKYVPWKNMSDIDVFDADKKKEKSNLIVVASLIDKLPNLGGMARTSEVFGVKTYVIDSLRHIQDKNFQGLSVSAERWVDMEAVRPAKLKDYLMTKKTEGYTIVAAEQTSNSKPLQNFEFPEKTLLLLGHEKEGIPCDLLPLMDVCVEIPQKGVIRSLNVHVTAAICIWEYARQNIFEI